MLYYNLKTKYYFNIKKKIFLINASNKTLGRLSSNIIKLIINKIDYNYTPNYNNINKVIIINANKIKFKKNKEYIKYSGYIGNKKKIRAIDLFKKNPSMLLKLSIYRMLPKNSLGKYAKKNIIIINSNKYDKNINNLIKYKI